jgi:hypothetical protein
MFPINSGHGYVSLLLASDRNRLFLFLQLFMVQYDVHASILANELTRMTDDITIYELVLDSRPSFTRVFTLVLVLWPEAHTLQHTRTHNPLEQRKVYLHIHIHTHTHIYILFFLARHGFLAAPFWIITRET